MGPVVYAEWAFEKSELTLTLYPLFRSLLYSTPAQLQAERRHFVLNRWAFATCLVGGQRVWIVR